jgi:solute carrier family 35, member E3
LPIVRLPKEVVIHHGKHPAILLVVMATKASDGASPGDRQARPLMPAHAVAIAVAPATATAAAAAAWTVDVRTAASMLLNFFSSTGLIVLNKIVMDRYNFRYATTLTFVHLVCTFLLLLVTSAMGVFTIKRLPLGPVAKLAGGAMGFICLTNLSLQHNSVGFYQVMKVMTTPTVVAIEALLYQKYLDNSLKISLIPVCAGVIATTATDFQLNLVGACFAVAGVVVTAFYQIWSGTLQKSLDCNALQLQTYVAPLAALFILPFVPIFDLYSIANPKAIWFYQFTPRAVALILVTGFFGFLVNISIFLVIGRSSPVSYNVLGHSKTVVILLSDFVLFGRPFNLKSTGGILITLCGVFWYTQIKLKLMEEDSKVRTRSEDLKESNLTSINKSTSASDDEEEEKKLISSED